MSKHVAAHSVKLCVNSVKLCERILKNQKEKKASRN